MLLSSLKLHKILFISVQIWKCIVIFVSLRCQTDLKYAVFWYHIWPDSKSKTNSATQSGPCSNISHSHYVSSPTCEIRTTKTVIKSVNLNIRLCTSFIFMKNITVSFPPSSKSFSHLNCSISPCDTRPGVRCLLTGGHTLLGFYFTGVFI